MSGEQLLHAVIHIAFVSWLLTLAIDAIRTTTEGKAKVQYKFKR
jgi:hypothetical protein